MTERTPWLNPAARRLLDATVSVVDEGGESAVRVQEVVANAGVSAPVLYRYFGSREGLVQAAQADRLVQDVDREMGMAAVAFAAVDDALGFRKVIDQILEHISSPARTEIRWRRINVLGSTYGRPDLTVAVAQIQGVAVRHIRGLFERPQQMGWLREGLDLDAFAPWFSGQLIGRIIHDLSAHDAGNAHVDTSGYDAIWADAIRHVLFG